MDDENTDEPEGDFESASPAADDGGGNVGYGNPPRSSRFKKNQSGNPKGRPRGSRNKRPHLQKAAVEALAKPVRIRENGVLKTVSTLEAAIGLVQQKALQGNSRAGAELLKIAARHGWTSREREIPSDAADYGVLLLAPTFTEKEFFAYCAEHRGHPDPLVGLPGITAETLNSVIAAKAGSRPSPIEQDEDGI